MYTRESIPVQTAIQDQLQFSNHMPPVSTSCRPSQSPQIHSHSFLLLNMSVFNLTGVCWTVCCLTYTTCLTVHIHSFHKKYIFVYTAFTISYNRAVAGSSVWKDVFCDKWIECPQNTSNPLIIQQSHHNVSCVHISACVCSPAAWSGLVGWSLRSILLCSCLSIWFVSGHARAVSPVLSGPWRYCRKQ